MVKWFVRYIACVDERSDGGMPDASFEQANNQMKGMAVRLASIRSKSFTPIWGLVAACSNYDFSQLDGYEQTDNVYNRP